jgi:hypothetical protein
MESPKKYYPYEPRTPCSVDECTRDADCEVYLYDYYNPHIGEFYEQDFTCPFLCKTHMQENERRAVGDRIPRGMVHYPYSNRHGAQGYTKYVPISEAYPILFDGSEQIVIPELHLAFASINEELIRYLARHPELLHSLDPRKFEELVADIFRVKGFDIELTPRTRDGGKDIYAAHQDSFGTSLYLIECKRYASTQKVGVEVVRGLYGVTQSERATMGIIATTSTFTKDAIDFATPLKYQLSLRDFDALKKWLNEYGQLM